MSFDKAIEHNKEHRKPYRGSKAIDASCRCHGSCMYCLSNRMYRTNKDKLKISVDIKDYLWYNKYIIKQREVNKLLMRKH